MKKALLMLVAVTTLLMAAGRSYASVIYTPMNVTANQTSAWNWFGFGVDADGFGLWVNAGAALRLETYQGPVIGTDEAGKVYLSSLVYGSEIGQGSTWVVPATPSYINDATHTSLNGNKVYVGVQLKAADGTVYYGWMEMVVSVDGLSVTLTGMAYQDVAGTSLMAGVVDRQVYYEKTEALEDLVANDGSMGTTIPVNLVGVDFSVASGRLIPATHYTAIHVPEGLTLDISITDARHAIIYLSGNAAGHAESDTRNDLAVNFLNAAFDGVTADKVIDAEKTGLTVKFFDPYKIVYEDLADLVCGAGGWAPFENTHYGNTFGLWHDGTDMRIETYGTGVIGTKSLGKSLITPLDAGTRIDSNSAWIATGAWPNEPYINTSAYSSWNGKHKYAGLQLVVGNATLYGWLNLEVSADGKTMTLYDWAFNTQPEGAIIAGQIPSSSPLNKLDPNDLIVSPNPFVNQLLITLAQPLKEPASLQILDLTGKLVFQEKLSSLGSTNHRIQASFLTSGVYFLKITSPSLAVTRKIVRE